MLMPLLYRIFRGQAKEFGFDERSYLDAVAKLTIIPEEPIPAIIAFFGNLAGMLWSMGVLLLRQMETEKELEQKVTERSAKLKRSMEEIKKLRGILPICSSCKKIRDDKGYRSQIETYIT